MTSTALLIMDVQQGIVERFTGGDDGYLGRGRHGRLCDDRVPRGISGGQ
jgi:hypothetical protein